MFTVKRKRRTRAAENGDAPVPASPGRRRKILFCIFLFLLLSCNIFQFERLLSSRRTILKQQQLLTSVREPSGPNSEVSGTWYGLCAKEKIHSVADFQDIVVNDPLLAMHFSDFVWRRARMGTLENASWAHVAYRKNEQIAMTRRVIRLPKGDGYITDGKRWLRTYCCNDYVIAGSENTDGPDPLALIPQALDAPQEAKPTVVGRGLPVPVVPIPEPGTGLLCALGVAGLGRVWLRRRSRAGNGGNRPPASGAS